MGTDDDSVGEWARIKLECLEKYLNAYMTIMQYQSWETFYIDAFAGRGQYRLRKQAGSDDLPLFDEEPEVSSDKGSEEYINGSPQRALEIKQPFKRYRFIEKHPERVELLQKLASEHPGRDIRVIRGNCRSYLEKRLIPNFDTGKHRAVVFLDPFGMQVPWDTIAKLGKVGGIEIFLNFPVGMAIQRFLRRDANFSPEQRERLDRYFGTDTWFEQLYRSAGEDLLGDTPYKKIPSSAGVLVGWYRERLGEVFKYVSEARLIKNSKGGHLYFLIFASQNQTGVGIANHILREGEKTTRR